MCCWYVPLSRRIARTGRLVRSIVFTATTIGASLAGPPELSPYDGPVLSTAAFVAAEGVNTHIPYTDGGYADPARIVRELKFLGVDRVRDSIIAPGINGSAPLRTYWEVAHAGIKFDFIVGGGTFGRTSGSWTSPSLEDRLDNIRWVARAEPGSVIAIEGANEINNEPIAYDGINKDRLRAALQMQRDLYRAVRSDSRLATVPIYYFTGYDAGGIPIGPDPAKEPGLADFNNQHPYPRNAEPPAAWVARRQALTNGSSGPAVYTETGYSTNIRNRDGVPPDVQARYTLALLLDAAKAGITTTYLYELMDAYAPGARQGDAGYGLFDWQGNPKPVALAIHNMNAILASPKADGRSLPMTPLALTVGAESSATKFLLLQRSPREHVVAIWSEQTLFKNGARQTPAPSRAELAWPEPQDVALYDPVTGKDALHTEHGVRSFSVTVSDHPLFLIVSPPSPATAQ